MVARPRQVKREQYSTVAAIGSRGILALIRSFMHKNMIINGIMTLCIEKVRAGRKPGSVVGQSFIWDACRHAPQAAYPDAARATPLRPYLALLRVGLAMRALLPAPRWALTPPFHPYPGRSRGGLTCKIHVLCDGEGHPLHFELTAGQTHEAAAFDTVMVGARISRTGNAMRQSGDLQGLIGPVSVGDRGLSVVIDEVVP